MSEKQAHYFRRVRGALVPADEGSLVAMQKIEDGKVVVITIRRSRNVAQMRLYWAMCGLVAVNHEQLRDKESVHQAIKLLAGWTDKVAIRTTGEIIQVPRSIAFDAMNPDEWDEYLREAKRVVMEDLLPGVQSEALREEIAKVAA